MQHYPKTAHVKLDGRHFIVRGHADGTPALIYERKTYAKGTPYECFHNSTFWHSKHHNPGKTVVRILGLCSWL